MTYSVEQDLRFTSTDFDDNLLGFTKTFQVLDYISNAQHPPFVKGAECTARFCVNKSGGTLPKGAHVLAGDQVGFGYPLGVDTVGGAATRVVGVVSPWIAPDTVADDAAFWLIVGGLTKGRYDGTSNILVGSFLETDAGGDFELFSTGPIVGVANEAISSGSSGDLFWLSVGGDGIVG